MSETREPLKHPSAWVTDAPFSSTQWNGNLARHVLCRWVHPWPGMSTGYTQGWGKEKSWSPASTWRSAHGQQVGRQKLGESGDQGTMQLPPCCHSWEQADHIMHAKPAWDLTPGRFQPETGCHSDSYQTNQKGKLRCPCFFFLEA